jgi:hypothetical protein
VKIRCPDPELTVQLSAAVSGDCNGLVFVAGGPFERWDRAEDELAEAFRETQAVVAGNGPVVYVVRSAALLGRSAPLDSAVADGLLAGARAIAFERQRFEGYASMVAIGDGVDAPDAARAVATLLNTRGSNGQPFVLGDEHLGAALP